MWHLVLCFSWQVVFDQRLDTMTLEVFSSLNDSVIVSYKLNKFLYFLRNMVENLYGDF